MNDVQLVVGNDYPLSNAITFLKLICLSQRLNLLQNIRNRLQES